MKKVVIIGAGPAGLTAAYELLKNGGEKNYQVEILERDQKLCIFFWIIIFYQGRPLAAAVVPALGGFFKFRSAQEVLQLPAVQRDPVRAALLF